MSHEVVALYRQELVVLRKRASLPIPESAYQEDGANELCGLKSNHSIWLKSFPIENIKALRSRHRTLARETDRLDLVTSEGNVKCFVRNLEVPNLYRAMVLLLGDHYTHRRWPPASEIIVSVGIPFLLLVLGLLGYFLLLVDFGRSAILPFVALCSIPAFLLGVLGTVLGLYTTVPGPRSVSRKVNKRPTKDLSGKEPFRLHVAGLAIAGLGSILLLYKYGLAAVPDLSASTESNQLWNWQREGGEFVVGFALFVLPCVAFMLFKVAAVWFAVVVAAVYLAISLFLLALSPSVALFNLTLFYYSPYLGMFLCHIGRSLASRNAQVALAGDQRPPILYLRSFESDVEDTLTPLNPLAVLFGVTLPESVRRLPVWARVVFENHPLRLLRTVFGRVTPTTEIQLAHFFRTFGPFVAIGKPGEWLATEGADRMYVKQDRWQQDVLDLMSRARFLVLQAAATQGFLWELGTTLESVPPERILFCLSDFRGRQNDYEDFRLKAESIQGWKFPGWVGNHDRAQFLFFQSDRTQLIRSISYASPILWPVRGQVTDLSYTLANFIDRESSVAPYKPRSYPGHALIAIILFLTVMPAVWVLVTKVAVMLGRFLVRGAS